jgi:hypothetical protein
VWNEPEFLRYRHLMVATRRGHIERLPSGSYRVHVYAGIDPVTRKPRQLKQICPDEPSAVVSRSGLTCAEPDHQSLAIPWLTANDRC